MRKITAVAAVVAAVATFGIGSAGAVQYGQADNGSHPWVGLVVFFDASDSPIVRCARGRCSRPRGS
jgi:hypothetical protein